MHARAAVARAAHNNKKQEKMPEKTLKMQFLGFQSWLWRSAPDVRGLEEDALAVAPHAKRRARQQCRRDRETLRVESHTRKPASQIQD
eukprot:2092573-Rhodomonas_salina.1